MKTRLNIPALLIAGFGLLAVSCGRSYLPTKYYRIDTAPQVDRGEKPFGVGILIDHFWAPVFYNNEMVYQEGDYLVGRYSYSCWTEPPAALVRRSVVNSLLASGLFTDIVGPADPGSACLTLRGELIRFDQIVNPEDKDDLRARCAFGLQIVETGTGKPLWKFVVDKTAPQKEGSSFAETISGMVTAGMREMISSLQASHEVRTVASACRDSSSSGK